ncbi:MAG: ketoacyl-ACP synthase III [Bacteroidales bacterium]
MNLEYYLPERILTNIELAKKFPGWDYINFENKVGIKSRHIAEENETALDLAEKACLKLIQTIDKSSIDFVLLCTQSPDYYLPASACILQSRLKLSTSCGALDFNLGCSGYVYGLALAKSLLISKVASNILLVVAETYSKHIHPKDKINRVIFGDGAAATLINKDSFSIGEFVLGTDGNGFQDLIVKNGGLKNRSLKDAKEYDYGGGNFTSDNHLFMDGLEIFNFSLNKVPELVIKTTQKNNLKMSEIDFFIFHQANAHMLNYLRIKSQIEPQKFCFDLNETGNTVSATIPIALKNSFSTGQIKKGNKVMLVGFGVGLSWGATIVTI